MFIKQYELWQTCNNNCEFCFNKSQISIINPVQQEKALEFVLLDIDNVVKLHGGNLSVELIGGEFFQGQLSTPRVKELFFNLLKKLAYYGNLGLIKQVCLFVTLTIGNQEDLFRSLDILLKDKTHNFSVWLSTSYDTRGRFRTNEQLNSWKSNMVKLSGFTDINKNTTIIFTQDFVNNVLEGRFNFVSFQKEFGTTLFFKHPLPPLINSYYTNDLDSPVGVYFNAKNKYMGEKDWFFPKRVDSLKVMSMMNSVGILDRLMGLNYRADDLDSKFDASGNSIKTVRDKNHNIESVDEEKSPCGHLLTYRCYSDSDKCMLCDKENILGEY